MQSLNPPLPVYSSISNVRQNCSSDYLPKQLFWSQGVHPLRDARGGVGHGYQWGPRPGAGPGRASRSQTESAEGAATLTCSGPLVPLSSVDSRLPAQAGEQEMMSGVTLCIAPWPREPDRSHCMSLLQAASAVGEPSSTLLPYSAK